MGRVDRATTQRSRIITTSVLSMTIVVAPAEVSAFAHPLVAPAISRKRRTIISRVQLRLANLDRASDTALAESVVKLGREGGDSSCLIAPGSSREGINDVMYSLHKCKTLHR